MAKWDCEEIVDRLGAGEGPCGKQTYMDFDRCFAHWKAREIAKRGGPEDWIRLPNARDRNTI